MTGLPVVLNVADRRCVVVGGGGVAARRARSLLDAGARVRVVAPGIDPAIDRAAVETVERPFEPTDLDGAWLVVVATDDASTNAAVAEAAGPRGVLVNRADDPEAGDFVVPAHARRGPLTLAVDTGGASASAAARVRDAAVRSVDPLWPELLELAGPWRAEVQRRFAGDAERRRWLLRSLTSPPSMAILQGRGAAAVEAFWRRLIDDADRPGGP